MKFFLWSLANADTDHQIIIFCILILFIELLREVIYLIVHSGWDYLKVIPFFCITHVFWATHTEEFYVLLAFTVAIAAIATYYDSICLWFFIFVFSIAEVVGSIYHFETPTAMILYVVFMPNSISWSP